MGYASPPPPSPGILQKKSHQSSKHLLSGAPPAKKNPGSAPGNQEKLGPYVFGRDIFAIKGTWKFRMSKWFGWKFLEGNVQLAISEMKISYPKILGQFNFQLRYPDRSISSML